MKFITHKSLFYFFIILLSFSQVLLAQPKAQTDLVIESKQVDLKGCIQMYGQKQFVIKTKEDYLKKIRKDAQTPNCVKNAENLDFEKFSYIGMQINSGYCRYPKGLKQKIIQNNSKKEYVLDVSYIDPEGQVCRALSRYDLWVQVPKLQEDFKVVFNVYARIRK